MTAWSSFSESTENAYQISLYMLLRPFQHNAFIVAGQWLAYTLPIEILTWITLPDAEKLPPLNQRPHIQCSYSYVGLADCARNQSPIFLVKIRLDPSLTHRWFGFQLLLLLLLFPAFAQFEVLRHKHQPLQHQPKDALH